MSFDKYCIDHIFKELQLRYVSCNSIAEDMNFMIFRRYILTTYRLVIGKWWLSLIKLGSLTMGMISFLLVWLFYIDHQQMESRKSALLNSCTAENLLILGSIIIVTITVYLLIQKSQMSFRFKEFFIRKLYGETGVGISYILLLETTVYILSSFLISLVLVDQVAPLFNMLTEKNVNTRQLGSENMFMTLLSFFIIIGLLIGLLPAISCSRKRAVDLLKKLPE